MSTVTEAGKISYTQQKYLGDRGLIILIAVLSAFFPLSTDFYLPALPGMGDYFQVSDGMVVISPAVTPMLGAFMLPYTRWRGLFWTLALIGIASMAGCLLLEETVRYRYTGTVIQSVRRLGIVSASALINCFALMFGSFGMVLVSLGGNNHIVTLGMINILVGLVCLGTWFGICKRNLTVEVPEIANKIWQTDRAKPFTRVRDPNKAYL
jgi:hypothetical protein